MIRPPPTSTQQSTLFPYTTLCRSMSVVRASRAVLLNRVAFAVLRIGRSEEHTSELQSRTVISYAVFCLKKKIGAREEVARLAGPSTRKIDLRGKTVLPGLIDSHLHAADAAMYDFFFYGPDNHRILHTIPHFSPPRPFSN